MLSDDEDDSDGIGEVGFLSETLSTEYIFWRIVCSIGFPIREVETWTLGEMRLAISFQTMQNDYKRIWQPYFEMKNET